VQAEKREAGQVMVENNAFRPAAFLVAALALLAFLPAMHIIAQVTTVALGGEILLIQFTAVTR
jgi:hypothetical protein